jgi:CD109 antigen
VNQDIELEVNSTGPLDYFMYQVIGRGDVIVAKTVQPAGKKTHTFKFLATYAMAPVAHVLVYYVKEDGEVVADALDIELEGALQNFVSFADFLFVRFHIRKRYKLS